MHVFFTEDGTMEKKVFLATWKDIPAQNEVQYTIQNCECNAGGYHLVNLTTKRSQVTFCHFSNEGFTLNKKFADLYSFRWCFY